MLLINWVPDPLSPLHDASKREPYQNIMLYDYKLLQVLGLAAFPYMAISDYPLWHLSNIYHIR